MKFEIETDQIYISFEPTIKQREQWAVCLLNNLDVSIVIGSDKKSEDLNK